MKKRILRFLLVFVLLATVIPISASACGGFVAIKGGKVFHSVYCEEMTFENLVEITYPLSSTRLNAGCFFYLQ